MESRSTRASFFWTLLSSALAGAGLNLAVSVLDHPRALESWKSLVLPLVVGFVVLLVAGALVLAPIGAMGRRLGLPGAAVDAGSCAALVLAAALAPLVEVGMRAATAERAGVVLVCAAGFVLCAALATGVIAHGREARALEPRAHAPLVVALPLLAVGALATLWALEYHTESGATRALTLLAGSIATLTVAWSARRLPAAPTLSGLAAFVLALGALGARAHRPSPSPGRTATQDLAPVVLITVDTLRADRVLGDDAAKRVPTPTLDALAADSVVFARARSAAPWTKPSLATLLTGVSPLVHGMTNRRARLPEELETLAERLRTAGYRTGGVGLNAHLERAFRLDQGFDDYAFPARLDYGIALGARVLTRLAPERFPELFPSTTAIADAAVDWIAAHAREPFFLWVHVLDPHWPYEPPPEWLADPERHPRAWGEPDMVTNVQAGNTKPGAEERERVEQLYAGEIRYVDDELARILGALRSHELYERALIVFASDHGEEFWEHGRYEHGHTLYDEVLRVPLFFKLPGAGPRARLEAAVSTEAVVPTVLEVLGLPFEPATLSSRSLASWWQSPESAREEPLFAAGTYYFGEKRAVVFGGKKLVLELDTEREELFDLAADPGELQSLTAARPDDQREGLRLVMEWQERCASLRASLGIRESDATEADADVLRRLRELGYAGTQ